MSDLRAEANNADGGILAWSVCREWNIDGDTGAERRYTLLSAKPSRLIELNFESFGDMFLLSDTERFSGFIGCIYVNIPHGLKVTNCIS